MSAVRGQQFRDIIANRAHELIQSQDSDKWHRPCVDVESGDCGISISILF